MKIAIIPARAGSKRLPNKNILPLLNKPLIVWTIEAAIQSKLFDHIYVSTDSSTIADIAIENGAEVPFIRPPEYSHDLATTNDVITHCCQWVNNYVGNITNVTLLQPTSPLRTFQDIINAHETYEAKNAKSIISVCKVNYPIQLCNKLNENKNLNGFISLCNNKRHQELETYYRINGAIYIFDKKHIGKIQNIYDENAYAYIMEESHSVDIDTHLDFLIAETIARDTNKITS
ncbi:hypothetical protein NUITMVP1_30760 [Proteus mirabilis]|uniref:acylneuraminate cytidylyltransferase family protein n=1 Tax=Enterobacterales TaxID=91347 RepID=UPI001F1075A7|nr:MULTISPECIES: acylneuraminate cytidylyltransferase family protein [Enterobacterales]MCH4716285.1 acylneuraminate cytidylyltransferase family protein [Escherichia coli]BDR99167.1 hypothetical protein NUITMVP1_30760 [Proteus mirabilis]HCJ8229349.1 acylneuraminate cytidylyltransferase family protein [Escherichia coli]